LEYDIHNLVFDDVIAVGTMAPGYVYVLPPID
jgi:hypothetical protein